jgi:hypothetical protein
MAYQLSAVIGPQGVLGTQFLEPASVRLADGLALVPIISRSEDAVGRFHGLTESLREQLVVVSQAGLVAYVEAEFFGGRGTQSAIAWQGGTIVVGPLHTQTHDGEEDGYVTTAELAINTVLRAFGVVAVGDNDEFDSLGLGRHRETAAWIGASGRLDA